METSGNTGRRQVCCRLGGIYKNARNMLRASLAADPSLKTAAIRNLEDLTPEQRLTIERFAANAGVGFAKEMFKELAAGDDIPRTVAPGAIRSTLLELLYCIWHEQFTSIRPFLDVRPATTDLQPSRFHTRRLLRSYTTCLG
jgi:hypothetical protein